MMRGGSASEVALFGSNRLTSGLWFVISLECELLSEEVLSELGNTEYDAPPLSN